MAKVPERVRKAHWQALDEATGEQDGKQRLQALIGELDRGFGHGGAKALSRTWKPLAPLLRDSAQLAEAARGVQAALGRCAWRCGPAATSGS